MAIAGYATKTAVTTTATDPTDADVGDVILSSNLNSTRAELATDYQGTDETALILGKKSRESTISGDYVSTDPVVSRLRTAHNDGSTAYVHILLDGATGYRVPVKVPTFSIESSQDGKVTFSASVKSVGADAASTLT